MLQATFLEYADESGQYFVIDENGFLLDPALWARGFSITKAREIGITLTDRHWDLINFIRDKFVRLGSLPPMRSVCKAAGFDKHELKSQFGSCLVLWKIAGLPDPGEEAKTYMN